MKWSCAFLALFFSLAAHAGKNFKNYEDYYRHSGHVIFPDRLERSDEVYSFQGERGMCGEEDSCRDYTATSGLRKLTVTFSLTRGVLKIHDRQFSRSQARPLNKASRADDEIPFGPLGVYLSEGHGKGPDVLCIEGDHMGSGRFRTKDVFLVLDPWGFGRKTRFLQLPGLHASCKSVRREVDGAIGYPVNRYVLDPGNSKITGLAMNYWSFKDGKSRPGHRLVNIRFIEPDHPFEFFQESK